MLVIHLSSFIDPPTVPTILLEAGQSDDMHNMTLTSNHVDPL